MSQTLNEQLSQRPQDVPAVLAKRVDDLTAAVAAVVQEGTTASNVGGQAEVFKQKSSLDLQFRTIKAGANITVTQNANDVTIAAAGGLGLLEVVSRTLEPIDQAYDMFVKTKDAAGSGFMTVTTGQSTGGASGGTVIGTGDATDDVSGDILIAPGNSNVSRGKFRITDGSEGTSGHVWTSTGANGEGHWAAPSGGGGGGQPSFIAKAWATGDVSLSGGSSQDLAYNTKYDPDNIMDISGGACKFTVPMAAHGLCRIKTKLSPNSAFNATNNFFSVPNLYITAGNVFQGTGDRLTGTWASGQNTDGYHFPYGELLIQLTPGETYSVKAFTDNGFTNAGAADINFTFVEIW